MVAWVSGSSRVLHSILSRYRLPSGQLRFCYVSASLSYRATATLHERQSVLSALPLRYMSANLSYRATATLHERQSTLSRVGMRFER